MSPNNLKPLQIFSEDLIEALADAIINVTGKNMIPTSIAGQILRNVIGVLEDYELKKTIQKIMK